MLESKASDHQKISFTAKLVALSRSGTGIPFARDVSELIGAAKVADDLAREAGITTIMPPVMRPLVEARYRCLVSAIKRGGYRQVLEFASGVSLRGLAMTLESPTLKYIETDLPELTTEKQTLLNAILAKHHAVAPRNLHMAVANILHWHEIEAVLEILNPDEPVAVIHEGLFMYLSPAEKDLAAEHIARILDRFGGSWITPDLIPTTSMNWLWEGVQSDLEKMTSIIEGKTGRSFVEYSFGSEQAIEEFCHRHGFGFEITSQIDGSYELDSLPAGESPELMTKLRQALKLWEMRRVKSMS